MAININELQKILAEMPASQNLMLVGKHGIGKSEILTQHFQHFFPAHLTACASTLVRHILPSPAPLTGCGGGRNVFTNSDRQFA